MRCINERPGEREEVKRIMQNLRKNRNNYRKMHGLPMKRKRALEKARNNELPRIRFYHSLLEAVRSSVILGPDIEWPAYYDVPNPNELRRFIGYDLGLGDCSSYISAYTTYGQKLINQNAVVKIVTSGEEEL